MAIDPETGLYHDEISISQGGPLGAPLGVMNAMRGSQLADQNWQMKLLAKHMQELQLQKAQQDQIDREGWDQAAKALPQDASPEQIQSAAMPYLSPSSAVSNASTITNREWLHEQAQARVEAAEQGKKNQAMEVFAKSGKTNREWAQFQKAHGWIDQNLYDVASSAPNADEPFSPMAQSVIQKNSGAADLSGAKATQIRTLTPQMAAKLEAETGLAKARTMLDGLKGNLARIKAAKETGTVVDQKLIARLRGQEVAILKAIEHAQTPENDVMKQALSTPEGKKHVDETVAALKAQLKDVEAQRASLTTAPPAPGPAANTATAKKADYRYNTQTGQLEPVR